jgi:hypothetical protein
LPLAAVALTSPLMPLISIARPAGTAFFQLQVSCAAAGIAVAMVRNRTREARFINMDDPGLEYVLPKLFVAANSYFRGLRRAWRDCRRQGFTRAAQIDVAAKGLQLDARFAVPEHEIV